MPRHELSELVVAMVDVSVVATAADVRAAIAAGAAAARVCAVGADARRPERKRANFG